MIPINRGSICVAFTNTFAKKKVGEGIVYKSAIFCSFFASFNSIPLITGIGAPRRRLTRIQSRKTDTNTIKNENNSVRLLTRPEKRLTFFSEYVTIYSVTLCNTMISNYRLQFCHSERSEESLSACGRAIFCCAQNARRNWRKSKRIPTPSR